MVYYRNLLILLGFILLQIFTLLQSVNAAALNDTGITGFADGANTPTLTTEPADYPRQDASFGRDAAANAGTLTKIGGGHAGFDFTKIANNGSVLPASATLGSGATDWACTRDNVTGMMWQVATYSGYTWDTAQDLPATVNATAPCGFNDWRIPTIRELASIVNYSRVSPSIDVDYFPNTPSKGFWSSSAHAYYSDNAWYVNFASGYSNSSTTNHGFYGVRLARGGQYLDIFNLTDNQDGTVTDNNTGLMWAKCSVGQTYNPTTGNCDGSYTAMTWQQALTAAKNATLAGNNDWRLPNVKELMSIVDYSRSLPSIAVDYFPNTPSDAFWSSSADAYLSDYAWLVYFAGGDANHNAKYGTYGVRLARGGQYFDNFNLTLNKSGSGSGTVTSSPAGINCGTQCSASFNRNTAVTLTAAAATNSVFSGWSGDCSGTTTTCTVTMSAAKTVTTTFTSHTLVVVKAGNGSGTVTSSPTGISCGTDCNEGYLPGTSTVVTLTATAATGSSFTGWSGACSGTATTCSVTMSAAKSVTATFNLKSYGLYVIKKGTGIGTITSSPSGISCGSTCSKSYNYGTQVTLTATPAAGSVFVGWDGSCSIVTALTCKVTISNTTTVTAIFNPRMLKVIKAGNGSGTVTSSPSGISCGTICTKTYTVATKVILTATAATGSTFAGWSGACSGTSATCTITVANVLNVTANFNVTTLSEVFPKNGAWPTGWTMSGSSNSSWVVANDWASAGSFSLRSGKIIDNQLSKVQVSGNFQAGNISFKLKVSSEANYDFLVFYIDGLKQNSWSGEVTNATVSFSVTAGTHTLLWSYEKDGSLAVGSDAAWIDEVTLPATN